MSESHASTYRVHSQSGNAQLRLLPFEMQVPLFKRRAPHMHAHGHTEIHTHITSSLLARAACWVTVNAFCAFLIYFLCNDEVEMFLLLRTVFFKQKGEWQGTTLQRQKMHSYLRCVIIPSHLQGWCYLHFWLSRIHRKLSFLRAVFSQ